MSGPMLLEREGLTWPHREASRLVVVGRAGGQRLHVQELGAGQQTLLLIHGTGASTHSWRDLAPLLAKDYRVVMADLPGHAFSEKARGDGLSLGGMARAMAALTEVLEIKPLALIGHSAGAAIACRMVLDGLARPSMIIGLNAALLPFPGLAGQVFPPLARMLFLNPFASYLFARRAVDERAVARLIRDTGSTLSEEGVGYYSRLFQNPRHIDATLGMMANWDLNRLAEDLPRLTAPLVLVVGEKDTAVPPGDAISVRAKLPGTKIVTLPGLGHLAHEEAPQAAAELILDVLAGTAIQP